MAGGACVITVVLMTGAATAVVTYPGLATTTPGCATTTGVEVVVVVVITAFVGDGGGGAETKCDSGSETHPDRSPRAPQRARTGISCLAFAG